MKVFYRKPQFTEDKKIIIEQVYDFGDELMTNGILRKELKVILEKYPSLDLLLVTIAKAQENYNNIELQGNKTVKQLEQEKKALTELQVMLSDMLGDGE